MREKQGPHDSRISQLRAKIVAKRVASQIKGQRDRNQLSLAPGLVCSALRKVRARLKNPLKSVDEYLAILTQQGLVATVADLEQFADLL